MTRDELLALRLYRQHLTTPADGKTICRDLNGVQAQFLSYARHSLILRGAAQEGWQKGLVKSWTLRGTMHLFRAEDLPLYLHRGRRRNLLPCDTLEGDTWITQERKAYFAQAILDCLEQGVQAREDLKAACFALGMTQTEAQSVFDSWGGTIRALAEAGKLCHQVQEKKAFCLCPPFTPMEREPACREMLRRYFSSCGPASLRDASYFFGVPQTEIRRYMEELPLRTVIIDGTTYFDLGEGESGGIPDCLFLAGFDPMLLSYEKHANPCLPAGCLRGIFTLAGIVLPAVLLRGQVVGKWKRERRRVSVELLCPVAAAELAAIARAAEESWPDCVIRMKKWEDST